MKGIIYYYSSTGNTKLVAEYLKRHITNVEMDICDIANDEIKDHSSYDLVGFASFAEYLGPPTLMNRFLKSIKSDSQKSAFLLNTYAGFSGPTQSEFAKQVGARGFNVYAGHSFITPMNYPPMRRNGKLSDDSPSQKDMDSLNRFIEKIESGVTIIEKGEKPSPLLNAFSLKRLAPSMPRDKVKKDFGKQEIDEDKCINCGNCARVCAYKAIEMSPNPVVDHEKCNGCWACYNTCPKQAIYTNSFRGEHQYKGPSKELIEKLNK